jgi:hypothetical protein
VSRLCRPRYTCTGHSWQLVSEGSCVEPPEGYCPEAPPTTGGACTTDPINEAHMTRLFPYHTGITCEYDSGVGCECYYCEVANCPNSYCPPEICPDSYSASVFAWVCHDPPADLNCPLVMPNLGEGCATEGTECTYGELCASGERVACRDGVWEQAHYLCPM